MKLSSVTYTLRPKLSQLSKSRNCRGSYGSFQKLSFSLRVNQKQVLTRVNYTTQVKYFRQKLKKRGLIKEFFWLSGIIELKILTNSQ